MFSDTLTAALEQDVVGQPGAIQAVVRGTTRVLSGLTPRERSWFALMFLGPGGSGKTQLVRTLARVLHGERRGLHVAQCSLSPQVDPWTAFAGQLLPMFPLPPSGHASPVLHAPPLTILLVEALERGKDEVARSLAGALDTGRLPLPGGFQGSLENCLVFLNSDLCARELLEEVPRIGFQGTASGEDAERDRLRRACEEQAEERFGRDLLRSLDGVVVFHSLDEAQLGTILDRRVARLNRWLEERGVGATLTPAARAYLVGQGALDPRAGARELVRAHRRLLEFPLADLLVSGRIPPGARVEVDRTEEHEDLTFTVVRSSLTDFPDLPDHPGPAPREVPIAWS